MKKNKFIVPVLSIIAVILIISMSYFLAEGFKFSTPEDMLVPPELNKEKQEMKEAVEKFKPANSSTYPVFYSQNKKSVNMIIIDLDSDSTSEIISFYKNKSDDKIGMFILKKIDSMWIKISDIGFNSYEISSLSILNLDDNDRRGNKEIVVESYENNNSLNPRNYSIIYSDKDEGKIKVIKELPCILMKIFDTGTGKNKNIVTINKNTTFSDYVLSIDSFNGSQLTNIMKKDLKSITNPYDMSIGDIYDEKKAIFIDYMNDMAYKNTNIVLIDKAIGELVDTSDIEAFKKHNYVFNIKSKDVDNDGIVEVGYKYKAPNYSVPIKNSEDQGLVQGYFKINKDYSLELVKEVYEDSIFGYAISLPTSFRNKYTVNVSKNNLDTRINFIDNSGKEYPLIQIMCIRKYEWQQNNEFRNSMQLIMETQDYVVAGKVLDFSKSLDGEDRERYLKMRSDVLILSNLLENN